MCQVSALDGDEDGFGTIACEASPGQDCDDENDAIHPEASEVCDGVDNDCDSLIDLMDGLSLAGTTQVLEDGDSVALDWSTTANNFGAVYIDRGAGGYLGALAFGTLDAGGGVAGGNILFGPNSGEFQTPNIAWGGGKHGVVYMANNQGNHEFYFVALDAVGTPGAQVPTVGDDPHDISYRSTGDWLIGITYDSSTIIRADLGLNPSGRTVGPSLSVNTSYLRVGTNQERSALVWQLEGTNTVQWARLTQLLTVSAASDLTAQGVGPDVVGTAGGYAISWATAEGLAFSLFDVQGATLCGPTQVPFGDGELATTDELHLAVDGDRVLVLMTEASGNVGLFRFDDNCELVDEALLTDEADAPGYPRIATGGGLVALAWTDTAEPEASVTRQARTRLVSSLLCE
jgi:hypothetical protein